MQFCMDIYVIYNTSKVFVVFLTSMNAISENISVLIKRIMDSVNVHDVVELVEYQKYKHIGAHTH